MSRGEESEAGLKLRYGGYLAFHVLLFPFLALRGLIRAKRRRYAGVVWARLRGNGKPPYPASWILLYAGGLGELRTALQFAKELRAAGEKDVAILVQSNVPQANPEGIPISTAPFNNPISSAVTLRQWTPRAVLAVEFFDNTHFAYRCRAANVPILQFNVPISDGETARHLRRHGLWRWLLVPLYATQGEDYAKRLESLGIPADRIAVTGPLALGFNPPEDSAEIRRKWKRILGINGAGPTVVAGSTYGPSEERILDAFQILCRTYPKAKLVLAPRRIDRLEGADSTLKERKLPFIARSSLNGTPAVEQIILLDTLGELKEIYSVADVAFVGGTFVRHTGGHTPLEALVWDVPITIGPYFEQQTVLVQPLLEAGIARVVEDAASLADTWVQMIEDPSLKQKVNRTTKEMRRAQANAAVCVVRQLLGIGVIDS